MGITVGSVPYGVDRFKRIRIEETEPSGNNSVKELTQHEAREYRYRLQLLVNYNEFFEFPNINQIIYVINRIDEELKSPQ